VLVGGADISAAAWRKRLRARSPWRLGLLREWVATSAVPDPLGVRPRGRLLLVDASCLSQPGGRGDDGRLPLADDCTAGRLGQGQVTDPRAGEHPGRYQEQARVDMEANRVYQHRRQATRAVQQEAAVA